MSDSELVKSLRALALTLKTVPPAVPFLRVFNYIIIFAVVAAAALGVWIIRDILIHGS